MKKVIKTVIWIVVVGVVAFGAAKIYQHGGAGEELESGDTSQAQAPLVRVAEVARGSLENIVFVTGTVEPDSSAQVLPETTGVLESFRLEDGTLVEEGMMVKQGDILGVVEHDDLKAALEEAEAGLRVAKASLQEAMVQLKDARREKARMEALFKDGTATEQQRDKAVTTYERAEAVVELSQAQLVRAEATLRRARIRYEDATVRAPVRGVISQKYVDEGSYVTPSTQLLKIINITHIEVSGGVAGKYLSMLEPGQAQVRMEVDAYPDREYRGVVDRVRPELDSRTRTVEITVRVPNADGKLKPGMFARMEVLLRRREDVPVVPDAALLRTESGSQVFIVKEGVARIREVSLGLRDGDRNEVLEGISAGDMVVVRGQHLLKDGTVVRAVEGKQ